MKKAWALTITVSILLCAPLFFSTATAVTGNFEPDSTPYVGIAVLFSDAARQQPFGYCSGFLLTPTVMVTAGHSLLGAEAVSVCFDQGPISYAIQNGQIIYHGADTIYTGAPVTYPQYIPAFSGNQEFSTSDIGLIILDQPVTSITEFPVLPQEGLTETLAAKTDLTVIGYGMQTQTNPRNNGPDNSWIGTLSRNSAQVELLKSNFKGNDCYLKLTANNGGSKGAIVFGDSGGPVIYTSDDQDIVLAVNTFANSANCKGVSYHTRIDTANILNWINEIIKINHGGENFE
jgi:hypothetical protein